MSSSSTAEAVGAEPDCGIAAAVSRPASISASRSRRPRSRPSTAR
ncbi:hypothetical protein [Lysobacter gummosus]